MQAADPSRSPAGAPPPELARAAFRELHGSRLHGFALLMTLGDRPRAARTATAALSAGTGRAGELRHPERAAAWLRGRVVRSTHGRAPAPPLPERRAGLAILGVDDAVLAGLSELGHLERAALIASAIERIDPRDVATIVGRDGARLDRLLSRARRRYLAAYAAAAREEDLVDGPIGERIRTVARRAMQ